MLQHCWHTYAAFSAYFKYFALIQAFIITRWMRIHTNLTISSTRLSTGCWCMVLVFGKKSRLSLNLTNGQRGVSIMSWSRLPPPGTYLTLFLWKGCHAWMQGYNRWVVAQIRAQRCTRILQDHPNWKIDFNAFFLKFGTNVLRYIKRSQLGYLTLWLERQVFLVCGQKKASTCEASWIRMFGWTLCR